MTLEELKKVSWSKLDKGIEYISLNNDNPKSPDSIHFSVKGFWGSNITIPADVFNEFQPTLDSILRPILNNKLSKSKHGYLKINFYEMLKPEISSAFVYFRDNDDSTELNKNLKMIRTIKGVVDVNYISKEMAKEKYLADGNENWDKVLDSNPLPASIEIKFDNKIILPEDYKNIRNKIKDEMLYTVEITFPSDSFEKLKDNHYILEYFR